MRKIVVVLWGVLSISYGEFVSAQQVPAGGEVGNRKIVKVRGMEGYYSGNKFVNHGEYTVTGSGGLEGWMPVEFISALRGTEWRVSSRFVDGTRVGYGRYTAKNVSASGKFTEDGMSFQGLWSLVNSETGYTRLQFYNPSGKLEIDVERTLDGAVTVHRADSELKSEYLQSLPDDIRNTAIEAMKNLEVSDQSGSAKSDILQKIAAQVQNAKRVAEEKAKQEKLAAEEEARQAKLFKENLKFECKDDVSSFAYDQKSKNPISWKYFQIEAEKLDGFQGYAEKDLVEGYQRYPENSTMGFLHLAAQNLSSINRPEDIAPFCVKLQRAMRQTLLGYFNVAAAENSARCDKIDAECQNVGPEEVEKCRYRIVNQRDKLAEIERLTSDLEKQKVLKPGTSFAKDQERLRSDAVKKLQKLLTAYDQARAKQDSNGVAASKARSVIADLYKELDQLKEMIKSCSDPYGGPNKLDPRAIQRMDSFKKKYDSDMKKIEKEVKQVEGAQEAK